MKNFLYFAEEIIVGILNALHLYKLSSAMYLFILVEGNLTKIENFMYFAEEIIVEILNALHSYKKLWDVACVTSIYGVHYTYRICRFITSRK